MKHSKPGRTAALLIAALLATAWTALPLPGLAAEELAVGVQAAALRNAPRFLAARVDTLPYATKVLVRERRGDWVLVTPLGQRSTQAEGWLHAGALTDGELDLSAGKGEVSRTAKTGELALAGKGFTEQVEAEMKKTTDLPFDLVDRIEAQGVDDAAIEAFVREGARKTDDGEEGS